MTSTLKALPVEGQSCIPRYDSYIPPTHMDPLSLLTTLASVLTSLRDKYEAYGKLQDAKQESLASFRKAVSRLHDDLRMYQKFIEDIHEPPVLASFIDSANFSSYWTTFNLALVNAESRYRDLLSRESSGAAPEKKGVVKGLIASVVFSDAVSNSIKRIDAATTMLIDDMETIERAYKNLYASHILHQVSYLRTASQKIPTTITADSSAQAKAIDDVVSSFYRSPFNLSTASPSPNISVEPLFKLNHDREVAERVTDIMKKEGALWVEGSDSLEGVDELSRIQTRLMEMLWAVCIPQMESDVLEYARCIGEERISNVDLKELSFGLKTAIARGKTQKFSIAFCGMVKAG
jgi:hypothetical protein